MPVASEEVMRPWLLTFRDKALENAFDRYALEYHHRVGDYRFFFVTTIVLFSQSAKTAFEQELRLLPALPFFLVGAMTAAMWWFYSRTSTERILQLRPYMSVIFRISAALAGSMTSHYMHWMFCLVPNTFFVILQFLMATETFGNFPYAFGITIKFQLHFPTHFFSYLIFLMGKARVTCEKLSHSAGASILYEIDSYVDEFFEFCFSFLQSTSGTLDLSSHPKVQCLHLSTFLMTFLSIGVVSLAVWVSERNMRLQFLQARQRVSTHLSAPRSSNHATDCVMYLVVLALGAMYWRWSMPLTRAVMGQ